ncbi:Ig-like domain-containing protein [Paenibacillus solisilvae]|uniref:Ig-like domain-containing protein n=1 Tax=Paenibacillus solisilvae TaxID=2486751 RepID=A0ABW0W8S2_9BACL
MSHVKQAFSARVIRTWASAGLSLLLILSAFAGIASAAEDTVTGFTFETTPSSPSLYVGETYELQTNATFLSPAGVTTKKDVTTDASWSSSNSTVIKVENGVLTGVTSGDAVIKAQYKGYTLTIKFTSSYKYDSLTLEDTNGNAAADAANVELGQSIVFGLTAKKSGFEDFTATNDAVWTSSDTAIATVKAGHVTLVSLGETTITAAYKGKTDSIKLKVASPYQSFTISPDTLMELILGNAPETVTASGILTSTGSAPTPAPSDIKWTSANTAVATVDNGTVTPVGSGTTTITAYHLGASTSISVVVRPAFEAMRISPKEEQHLSLKGSPAAFTLTVVGSDEQPEDVSTAASWTSSNVFAATVSVDNGKVLVTPKGVGTTTIKASYKGVSQQVNVTVYPTVSMLTAASDKVSAFLNEAVTLPKITAKTLADESIDVSGLVTWKSSNTDIVNLVDGKWTANKAGTTLLTAEIDTNKSVSVTVTVYQKPLVLTADKTSQSIVIGKEVKLPTIKVTYEDGSEEDVTNAVTWKSSSSNLLLKALNMRGLVVSNVTLTGTYLGKSITIRVAIEEEITKLFVDASSVVLNPNRTKTLKVTGVYKSGKSVSLSSKMDWTMTPETVASIKGSTIKGLTEGTAKLEGSYQDKSVQITVSVVPKLKKLTLNSKSFTMNAADKGTIKVTAEYENGKTIDVSGSAVWSSSNDKAVTVDHGAVTGIAKGSAAIKAAFGGKSISIRITIK